MQPERPAIVLSKDEVLTYGALGLQVASIGAKLRVNGIGRTAKVAILLPDSLELAVAIVASACHAVAVPLNPKATATEIDGLFARLHIDAVLTSNRIDTAARAMAVRLGIPLFDVTRDDYGSLKMEGVGESAALHGEMRLVRDADPDDLAVILQTSATTGRPKLVPVTHRNLVINADRRTRWFNFTADDRAFCAMPFYYAQGLKAGLFSPLLAGASVVCAGHRVERDIIELLADLRPTWFDAAGQVFHMNVLESVRRRQGLPLNHCLRFILSAGLSAAVRQGLEEVFRVPVLETYGLSEAGTVAANSNVPQGCKLGTMGKPWPNEVAIRADDGHLLPPGAAGEVVVRGPVLMPGYLDDQEANSAAFVDGWFRTGDLGSLDSEGFLTVLGRIREFINRGGEKISPYEVEQALLLHPSIREAAAFSVQHPRLGENVAAAVVLVPGVTTTAREIKAFLSDHLAPFKIPQTVSVKLRLPKGATGKTLRRQLSEEAAERVRQIAPPGTPLEHQILEVWRRLLGRDDFGIDDDFFEAGGDSLLAMDMLSEVEALSRQQIPPSQLRSVYTVRELAAAVLRSASVTKELITCAKSGRGTPFIFCHGDYTTRGLYALKLADMLSGEHPIFLVHPNPKPDAQLTIQEMARARMAQILAAHPTGTFCLGGYCNGGLLAWEIASQLEYLGREVDFVALIDVPSVNARPLLRAIAKLIRFIIIVAPKEIGPKFERRGMRTVWAMWYYKSLRGRHGRAIANYVPPKLATAVICMTSAESRARAEFSPMPWKNLAPNVGCEHIPGTHRGCITQHVREVVSVLNVSLSRITATRSGASEDEALTRRSDIGP